MTPRTLIAAASAALAIALLPFAAQAREAEPSRAARPAADVRAGAGIDARPAKAPVPRRRMLRWRLSQRGLGPLRIGMRLRTVARISGRRAVLGYSSGPTCALWTLRGAPRGLSIMVANGRVARFEASAGRWRSSRGIAIGSRGSAVRRRYPSLRVARHPYTKGHYLNVQFKRGRMTFETSPGGRVTSFRGGRSQEVRYIEGCA